MTEEEEKEAQEALRPYHEWVGRVASIWSQVERVIDDAIWTLARVEHHTGACITSQLPTIYSRFNVLISLIDLHGGSDELKELLEPVSRKARGLAKARNEIIHDVLAYNEDKKAVVVSRVSTRESKLEMEDLAADLDHFKKTSREIAKFHGEFITLRGKIFDELEASVGRFPRRPSVP